MKKAIIISLAVFTTIIFACSKSSEDNYTDPPDPPGGGNSNCDTASIEYQADIVPILTANCYACHGTNTNSGSMGIVLEGYENIKPKADNGTLIGVITHTSGYPAMPKDGTKLSDCNINKIRAWINQGTQNN